MTTNRNRIIFHVVNSQISGNSSINSMVYQHGECSCINWLGESKTPTQTQYMNTRWFICSSIIRSILNDFLQQAGLEEGWSFWVNTKFYEFSGGVVFRSTVLNLGPPTWNLHHVKSKRDVWARRVSGEIEHCHLDFSIWYFSKPFYQNPKRQRKNLNRSSFRSSGSCLFIFFFLYKFLHFFAKWAKWERSIR